MRTRRTRAAFRGFACGSILATSVAALATGDPAPPAAAVDVAAGASTASRGIRYRTLEVQDFRATSPPLEYWGHRGRLGAVTCVFIGTDGEVPMQVRHERIEGRPERVHVRVTGLRAAAWMDPDCSWWNPETPAEHTAYTLQHEQIHFALTEIAARRLAQAFAKRDVPLEARAATFEEAETRVRALLKIEIRSVGRALQDEHDRLDEETSAQFDPVAQARWAAHVETQLGERALD